MNIFFHIRHTTLNVFIDTALDKNRYGSIRFEFIHVLHCLPVIGLMVAFMKYSVVITLFDESKDNDRNGVVFYSKMFLAIG